MFMAQIHACHNNQIIRINMCSVVLAIAHLKIAFIQNLTNSNNRCDSLKKLTLSENNI